MVPLDSEASTGLPNPIIHGDGVEGRALRTEDKWTVPWSGLHTELWSGRLGKA